VRGLDVGSDDGTGSGNLVGEGAGHGHGYDTVSSQLLADALLPLWMRTRYVGS
jgi:hypothetical protein